MTFGKLKASCRVLLTGDNVLPKSDDDMLAALEMAYVEISNQATALKLLTVNKDNAIMRMGPGDTFIRMPKLPKDDNDELDIDSELGPAVARIIASYVSKEKGGLHIDRANRIVMDYEAKVQTYIETQNLRREYDECDCTDQTPTPPVCPN